MKFHIEPCSWYIFISKAFPTATLYCDCVCDCTCKIFKYLEDSSRYLKILEDFTSTITIQVGSG